MSNTRLRTVIHQIRALVEHPGHLNTSDADLLARFVASRDEAAFTSLVRRHGPMVLAIARRILRDRHEAEDVYQATFLLLALKGSTIRVPASLTSWLHGVARRLAVRARTQAVRRAATEQQAIAERGPKLGAASAWQNLEAVLDDALAALPERYRLPLVLCYLQGKTQEEVARILGRPLGTVRSWLARSRSLLRSRLERRGVTLSSGGIAAALLAAAAKAGAAVNGTLVRATTTAAMGLAAGRTVSQVAPAPVTALLAQLGRAASLARVKLAMLLLGLGLIMAGAGALGLRTQDSPDPATQAPTRVSAPAVSGERRVDANGDPLPAEALARLGTIRLRNVRFAEFIRFTPDGKAVLTYGGDGVRCWDVATGRQRYALPPEIAGDAWAWANNVSLSPDGTQLATADNASIYFWEVTTGKRARTLRLGRHAAVLFSPNGKRLASLEASGAQLDLLDVATGQPLWSWRPEKHGVDCVAFTPDGKTVIVAGWNTIQVPPLPDNTMYFLDARTGQERRRINLGESKPHKIALSRDGVYLVVGCIDHIRVWRADRDQELFRLDPPVTSEVSQQKVFRGICFVDEGKSLLTAWGGDDLILWDLATGKEQGRIGQALFNSADLALSPDGKTIAAFSGMAIRLLDRSTGQDRLLAPGHQFAVQAIAITPDGQTVATAGWDRRVILWDMATGRERRRRERRADDSFYDSFSLAQDGSAAFSPRDGGKTLLMHDLATGNVRTLIPSERIVEQPAVVTIVAGGKVLAVTCPFADQIDSVDSATGQILHRLKNPGPKLCSASFSRDGRTLVAFYDDRTAHVWDVATGTERRRIGPMGKPTPVNDGPLPVIPSGERYEAALSEDAKWIAFGSSGGYLLLIDTATGQAIRRMNKLNKGAGSLAFSPDGRMLAVANPDEPTLHLLEVATGRERHAFTGHRGLIQSLAFSADGNILVSGSWDTTALVWDLTGRLTTPGIAGQPLSTTELDACWTDLASEDAARSYRAIQRLTRAPSQAVPWLTKHLAPVPVDPARRARVRRLLTELDREEFAVRENAVRELKELGPVAEPLLEDVLRANPTLELRRRAESILADLKGRVLPPAQLRELRAVEALERIASPQALRLLGELAKGAPEARLTREAVAARYRLRSLGPSHGP